MDETIPNEGITPPPLGIECIAGLINETVSQTI